MQRFLKSSQSSIAMSQARGPVLVLWEADLASQHSGRLGFLL